MNIISLPILGCCGYHYLTAGFVSSAVVMGTEEEIDEFLKLGEEQDKLLLKGMKGATWKLKSPTRDMWYAAYSLPTLGDGLKPFIDPKAQKISPKVLKWVEELGGWTVTGGVIESTPLEKYLKYCKQSGAGELDVVQLTGFGTNDSMYKMNYFAQLAAHTPRHTVFGVTFAARDMKWVQNELGRLRKEFNVLVDVPWHNPRYTGADHDLHTMFFTRKES